MKQLVVTSLTKSFFHHNIDHTLFSDINYTFVNNTTYAIMGPSGCGKSTLLHLLAGIDVPTKGSITLDHQSVCTLTGRARAQSLALVLQSSLFINELTVVENCALAGIANKNSTAESLIKAKQLLEMVELTSYCDEPIGVLSGGQRQRAALARALMNHPTFLIADELTGNLDHTTAHTIMQLIKKLQAIYHFGVIVTTHDPVIARYMDIILMLEKNTLNSITHNLL